MKYVLTCDFPFVCIVECDLHINDMVFSLFDLVLYLW